MQEKKPLVCLLNELFELCDLVINKINEELMNFKRKKMDFLILMNWDLAWMHFVSGNIITTQQEHFLIYSTNLSKDFFHWTH